jgi:hypothetical protein
LQSHKEQQQQQHFFTETLLTTLATTSMTLTTPKDPTTSLSSLCYYRCDAGLPLQHDKTNASLKVQILLAMGLPRTSTMPATEAQRQGVSKAGEML